MTEPRRARLDDRVFDTAALVVLIVASALVWLTWPDYGISWDERVHMRYGQHIYDFFDSGFEDETALSYRIDYLYGGGFDLLGAIMGELTVPPLDIWGALHLLGALIGPLGFWGCWQLARTLGGSRAGLLAAMFISATSVYWGHAVNNPKDMPFAVGYVWAMVFLVKAIRSFPRVGLRQGLWLAFTMGMAMSVRIGGLLILCYFVGAIVVWLGHQVWQRRSLEAGYRYGLQLGSRAMAIAAGAWAVMLVWWPWALYDPLRRPLIALTRMSKFMAHKRKMPFAGERIWTYDVDWRYMPHYFGLKLPEFIVIVALLAFVVAVAVLIWRARDFRLFNDNLVLGTVLVSIVFPWVYAVAKDSVFYDGLRHFLFEVPIIVACVAWFCAAALERGLARLERGRAWARPVGGSVAALVIALLCADQYASMARLHPYQYVYFNRFIGGLEGAYGKYDTDYYAATYTEAGRKLAEHLWQTEPDAFLNTEYTVNGCTNPVMVLRDTPPNFTFKSKLADFWTGYTRKKCHMTHDESPILFEIEREGTRLNVMRDVREWRDAYLERKQRKQREQSQRVREQARARRERAREDAAKAKGETGPEGEAKPKAGKARSQGPVIRAPRPASIPKEQP